MRSNSDQKDHLPREFRSGMPKRRRAITADIREMQEQSGGGAWGQDLVRRPHHTAHKSLRRLWPLSTNGAGGGDCSGSPSHSFERARCVAAFVIACARRSRPGSSVRTGSRANAARLHHGGDRNSHAAQFQDEQDGGDVSHSLGRTHHHRRHNTGSRRGNWRRRNHSRGEGPGGWQGWRDDIGRALYRASGYPDCAAKLQIWSRYRQKQCSGGHASASRSPRL